MGRYLELAKKALPPKAENSGGTQLRADAVPRDVGDEPYAERVRSTLKALCPPDYPAGMVEWLERARPDLYEDLTSRIPAKIDRLWDAHAPLDEFQAALDRMAAAHREACQLYREHLAKEGNP